MKIGHVDTYQVGVKRCPLCGGNRAPKQRKRPMCPRCHNTGIIDFDERPEISVPQVVDYRSEGTWGGTPWYTINPDSGTTGTTCME